MTGDTGLSAEASLLGRLGPWGSFEAGQLTYAGGVVAFTTNDDGRQRQVFSAPVSSVKIRSPWVYFGLGLQMTVDGKRHRIWFVRLRSAAGEQTLDGQSVVVGNAFEASELSRARAITRQWRATLG